MAFPSLRSLSLPAALALCLAAPAHAHTVAVNAGAGAAADQPQLSCSDTIYVHVDWDPRLDGQHTLRAVWRNASTDFAHTSDIVTAPNTPSSYLWLRFDPAPGAGFARLVTGDRGDGDFAGDWTVQLSLDGRPFAEKRFKVQC